MLYINYKFITDIIMYIVVPILLCKTADLEYLTIAITISILIAFFYTAHIKNRDKRVNISCIVFSIIFFVCLFMGKDVSTKYENYIFSMNLMILISVVLCVLSAFDKNMIKQFYVDYLKTKGCTDTNIFINIKKKNLNYHFNKWTYLIIGHLLSMSFIKLYSVFNYGENGYLQTSGIEIVVCVVFLMYEIYTLSSFMSSNKLKKNSKGNKNSLAKNNGKISFGSSNKVINFLEYKNENK